MVSNMAGITTKDSGRRQTFDTGARRDIQDKKPRFDLIPEVELDLMQQMRGGAGSVFDDLDVTSAPITEPLPEIEVALNEHNRMEWTGLHRDYRPDLIPNIMTNRLAHLYGRGATKYGDNNWQKGIPLSRIYASLFRHLIQWAIGDRSEDHLAAVIWNATALMWTEHKIVRRELPASLADRGPLMYERLEDGD